MGIHNLTKYINANEIINLTQRESGNNVYISNIVYFDITYKLIEIYEKFTKVSNKTDVNELLTYVENELVLMFNKLNKNNRLIYVFIDYRLTHGLKDYNILFKNFLNMNGNEFVNDEERVNAIPMIKRKYLKLLDENVDENEKMKYLINNVRCMFELKSIYAISNKINVEKYVSIPYLMKKEKNEEKLKMLNELLDAGKFRYLILRGGKHSVKRRREEKLFPFLDAPCLRNDKSMRFNVNKLLFNSKNDCNSIDEFYNYIPFTIIIYMFPLLIKKINFDNVKFFGCVVESDFAISKHVHAYSKNAFPMIYSSDTDMLCLMCDVDCTVKLSIKNDQRGKNQRSILNENMKRSNKLTLFVNPVMFWREIFNCDLRPKIIKILCVLMGTDYNPYHPKSPIHIRYFDDILKILNVGKFEDIDEDVLLAKIYVIMRSNENNVYCKQTAIALNVYLNELEGELHFITKNCEKIDCERFLKYSRRNAFV